MGLPESMESPAPPLPRHTSPGSSMKEVTAGSDSSSSAYTVADGWENRPPLSNQNQVDLSAGESSAPPVPQLQVAPPPVDYFQYLSSNYSINGSDEEEAGWMENISDYIDVTDHDQKNEPWLKYFDQSALAGFMHLWPSSSAESSSSSQMKTSSGHHQDNHNGEGSSSSSSSQKGATHLWKPVVQYNLAHFGHLPVMHPFVDPIAGIIMDPFAAMPSYLHPSNNKNLQDGRENPLFNWLPDVESTTTDPSSSSSSSSSSSLPTFNEKASNDFKNFDTIEECFADHYYLKSQSSIPQPKSWARKVQEEWEILQKDLPEDIFVRVCETRMDILRAAIIGAQGTPYYDGLFFFDISFPSNYPNVPPTVHYYSGGLRINPNLYESGHVCLSLLNTWAGSQKELWIPGVSTMLQVLVSIQALILNANPCFNEPGYKSMEGTQRGDMMSSEYNETTALHSLQTMVYTMRRPPKHFEELVFGHFRRRAYRILSTCRAYMEGAPVGGGDEQRSCSEKFRKSVSGFMETIVGCFKRIGVEDCDKFLPPPPPTPTPTPAPNEPPASE